MKKYRIIETIYRNGRKEYLPQVKTIFGWVKIGFDGDLNILTVASRTYDGAQDRIDLHFGGNTKVKKKGYFHQYKG